MTTKKSPKSAPAVPMIAFSLCGRKHAYRVDDSKITEAMMKCRAEIRDRRDGIVDTITLLRVAVDRITQAVPFGWHKEGPALEAYEAAELAGTVAEDIRKLLDNDLAVFDAEAEKLNRGEYDHECSRLQIIRTGSHPNVEWAVKLAPVENFTATVPKPMADFLRARAKATGTTVDAVVLEALRLDRDWREGRTARIPGEQRH
jgi:hypothetical protein